MAEMTENIPHPYEDGMAEISIGSLLPGWEAQKNVAFAISLHQQAELIGCRGLSIVQRHKRASLGYWMGTDYWNKGFCSEAAAAERRKIGMYHEATMHDYVLKKMNT